MFAELNKEQLQEIYQDYIVSKDENRTCQSLMPYAKDLKKPYGDLLDINEALSIVTEQFFKEIAKRYVDGKTNNIRVQVTVDYDDYSDVRIYEVETTDDFKTACDNIYRSVELLNSYSWDDDWESYEEFQEFNIGEASQKEYDTMLKCFNGYNELTLIAFVREMYGYELKPATKLEIAVRVD